jgi:hypothetical protein
MDILTFKMWEDAAANSAGGGGIDGIGVGAKGEPGVRMKKKKKIKEKGASIGSQGKADDWERRSRLQAKARSNMWKALGKKLRRK